MPSSKWKSLAIFVTLVSLLVLSVDAVLADEPYNLGVVLSLTGGGALYCKDGVDAIQLAVEEINAKGGFLGKHKIAVFVGDDRADPKEAVKITQDLILKDKVRCVLGPYSSACGISMKPVCREHKVLHIPAIANSEGITMVDFSPYTFSVVPNTYMQAKAVALWVRHMAKSYKWKTYATIASDYEWGRSTQGNFVKLMREVAPGVQLTKEYWPKFEETDFEALITEIMNKKPSFVYGSLPGKDNEAFIDQAKRRNFFEAIPYPGSLISVTELIHQAKTLPRGIVGLCRAPFFAHMDQPRMVAFVKAFRDKYGRYPSDGAVLEYDSVYILNQGIDKAGAIDTERVKDALSGMAVETTRGRLFFRKIDNQLSCSSYVGKVADEPDYPFPVYRALVVIKGPDSWRPEQEIVAAREKKE